MTVEELQSAIDKLLRTGAVGPKSNVTLTVRRNAGSLETVGISSVDGEGALWLHAPMFSMTYNSASAQEKALKTG